MSNKMKFRTFLKETQDIFGFDDELRRMADAGRVNKVVDEKPIQPFNSVGMLEHLSKMKVGVHPRGFQDFTNVVQWGTKPGALRVRVGSQYTVYIERLLHDLDNNPVWVTKKVYRINTDEYKQYAESVGDAIHDEIEKIAVTNLDGTNKEYKDVHELAQTVKETMDAYANNLFVFDRIKKVSEHNAVIVYQVKGGGVGALQTPRSQGRINQIVCDISFNEHTGLIRIMNTSIQTGHEGVSWHIMPSSFEGMFAPTQDPQEIAEAVTTAMKWF